MTPTAGPGALRPGRLGVVYVGLGTAAVLLAWRVTLALFTLRDWGGPEQANTWTPVVVAPVLTVYVAVALGLLGRRWSVWRWIVPATAVSACMSLAVVWSVHDAARAYEPELFWLALFFAGAPAATMVAFAANRAIPRTDERDRRLASRA